MIHLIIGRREQGKTTLAYFMASRVAQRLIFDPRGMIAGQVRCTTNEGLSDACDALADREINEVTFTPFGDVQKGFEAFCLEAQERVSKMPDAPLAIMVDEVAFVNTNVTAFQWVLRCSKRDVIHILITGHRPKDITTDIRAIADHWLLFACRQEHDLKIIEERTSDAVFRASQNLKPRQCIHWDDAKGTHRLMLDPTAWYLPLTPRRSTPTGSRVAGLDDLPADTFTEVIDKPRLF